MKMCVRVVFPCSRVTGFLLEQKLPDESDLLGLWRERITWLGRKKDFEIFVEGFVQRKDFLRSVSEENHL